MNLLLLLLLININWASECYVCHKSERFPLNNTESILKDWLSTGKQINQKGHIWIPKERLITPAFKSINSYSERVNFYGSLSKLAQHISYNGGSKTDLKNLKNLMNQGIKEVPVFEQYWKEG